MNAHTLEHRLAAIRSALRSFDVLMRQTNPTASDETKIRAYNRLLQAAGID